MWVNSLIESQPVKLGDFSESVGILKTEVSPSSAASELSSRREKFSNYCECAASWAAD